MTSKEESTKAAMEYLRTVPTCVVADAMAKMNVHFQGTMGLFPIRGFEDSRIAGPVITIKIGPMRATGYRKPMTFFELVRSFPAGSVVCMESADYISSTGDNEATMAKRAGIVGMIIDGGLRDVAAIRNVGLPIVAKSPSTRLRHGGWELTGYNVPIVVAGVQVHPGDFVVADEDGAVFVPFELLEQTVEVAKSAVAIEEELDRAIARNAPLDEFAGIYARKAAKVAIKRHWETSGS